MRHRLFLVSPGLSKVKISPSHLAALLGVLGSELQLERRRLFLLGETCSSVAESKSTCRWKKNLQRAKKVNKNEQSPIVSKLKFNLE